jgi:hypothetical protein
MQNLPGNFQYALRQFRLSPVFTAAAVLTLVLGIGGTTADLPGIIPDRNRNTLLVHVHADIFSVSHRAFLSGAVEPSTQNLLPGRPFILRRMTGKWPPLNTPPIAIGKSPSHQQSG